MHHSNEIDSGEWLRTNCPSLWSLLNEKARKHPPAGLVEHMSPRSQDWIDARATDSAEPDAKEYFLQIALSQAKRGQKNLVIGDKLVKVLAEKCGAKTVGDTYRRDFSGIRDALQLKELLCEIAFCASISKLSPTLSLRPKNKSGTSCDTYFQLAGTAVYGEAKRYEDTWATSTEPRNPIIRSRSLVKTPSGIQPHGVTKPRYMGLRSKLEHVPRQFPKETLNLLFVFHSSLDDSDKLLQQALLGENSYFKNAEKAHLDEDGLFASEEWQAVSGCCYSQILADGSLRCPVVWANPRAFVPMPEQLRSSLICL